MAVDFLTHPLSFTPAIPPIRNPTRTTLAIRTSISPRVCQTSSSLLCKSNLGFPTPRRRCRSFQSFVRLDDSEPQVSEKKVGGKASEKQAPDLKTLIKAYKKAILNGDEYIASEIEATIYILENEKIELAQKTAALLEDIASQKEKYIRTQADFDNFRKKFDKDKLKLTSRTQKEVLESLLPVVDDFEKAKQQITPETDKGKKINTSYQSIYKQFVETLRSLHVSVVGTVGKPFDPLVHEAIAREESQGFKEGIVIREVRRGFLLGDQLLRPAGVIVSAGHKKSTTPTSESEGQPTTASVDET